MSFSSSQRTNSMGATILAIGLSATAEVTAPAGVNGYLFKKQGGGTLAVVNGASSITTQGYLVGDTEVVSVSGPAKFYLASAGTTVTVGIVFNKSDSV